MKKLFTFVMVCVFMTMLCAVAVQAEECKQKDDDGRGLEAHVEISGVAAGNYLLYGDGSVEGSLLATRPGLAVEMRAVSWEEGDENDYEVCVIPTFIIGAFPVVYNCADGAGFIIAIDEGENPATPGGMEFFVDVYEDDNCMNDANEEVYGTIDMLGGSFGSAVFYEDGSAAGTMVASMPGFLLATVEIVSWEVGDGNDYDVCIIPTFLMGEYPVVYNCADGTGSTVLLNEGMNVAPSGTLMVIDIFE